MSLVTLIRDYVDVASSTEQLDGYTLSSLAYHIITFLFIMVKQVFVYCFTFHWLQDLSYFCLTPPSLISSFANVNEVEEQPLSHLLAFSDSALFTGIGLVLLGFFNGCFSCMHLSAGHLITIQRMLVQGVPAGLCSAFGTALGQFTFLVSVLFGFRGLLLPWLALEPLHFLMGTAILLSVASTMAQDRRTVTVQWSAKRSLLIYAFTSFLLAWCEQAALFQWMGNLSFGAEPTLLETAPFLGPTSSAFGNVQQLTHNISYLLFFFLGSIVGASFIGFLLQRFLELALRQKGIAVYYGLVKQANLPLATLVFTFGFGSLPYYGFDYLITKGFGFVPHEQFFKQTLFSPTNLVSKTSQAKELSQGRLEDQLALLFTLEGERSKSFAVDTTPFDDGQYLKANQKRPQAFEDLNYRGEHLWTNRLSRISNIREQANQTQSSFLGPVFSWMRAFLWGDGPTATNNNNDKPGGTAPISEGGQSKANTFGKINQYQVFSDQAISNANSPSYSHKTSGLKIPEGPKGYALSVQSPKEEVGLEVESMFQGDPATPTPTATDTYTSDLQEPKKKELSPEKEQMDNYVKEFDRQFDKGFSNFYDADSHSLIEVEDQWQEKRIKEKCYTNPIYKFLLNTEIDAFLARQPDSHWLSPQEEFLLLKRRQLLGNYYNTLALTSQVSTSEALEQLVPKSYANTIYNHQFKGTLKVARRLFSIRKDLTKMNRDSQVDETLVNRVIKFDQPLFYKDQEKKNDQQTFFHEELKSDLDQSQQSSTLLPPSFADPLSDDLRSPNSRSPMGSNELVNPKLSDHRSKSENRNTLLHQNAATQALGGNPLMTREDGKERKEKRNIFSLEQAESSPLYAGWDEQLRKLIITNRFQNQGVAGYTFSELPVSSTKNQLSTIFTTWPIPNPFTKNDNASDANGVSKENTLKSKRGESIELNKNFSYPKGVDQGAATQALEDNPSKENYSGNTYGSKEGVTLEDEEFLSANPSPLSTTSNSISDSSHSHEIEQVGERKKVPTSQSISKNNLKEKQKPFDFLTKPLGESLKIFKSKNDTSVDKNSFVTEKKSRFLFQTQPSEAPITNDMINALLQWQKLIKENKQLSKEDKQAAKEKVSYWPENVHRANWSNEFIDNDMELDEPAENVLKKQTLLWEFMPPSHGGFLWSGSNWNH